MGPGPKPGCTSSVGEVWSEPMVAWRGEEGGYENGYTDALASRPCTPCRTRAKGPYGGDAPWDSVGCHFTGFEVVILLADSVALTANHPSGVRLLPGEEF